MDNLSTISETQTVLAGARDDSLEPELERLIDNYRKIIETKSIYYPVAYRFGPELGRGQQGIVFKAYRHGARGCMTRHAIKLFDPSIYPSSQKYWTDMGRVAAQISFLQSFDTPNLIRRDIYEEFNGIGYSQMNIIEGIDVQQLIYGRHFDRVKPLCSPRQWAYFTDVIFRMEDGLVRLQPGVAVYIVRSALRGLEVLHKSGYLHSDIKPSNVMVDKLGLVKLVDYGRAVRVDEKVSFLLGTPLYMSPETHVNKRSVIQSDIYSLGLVLVEMLRGQPVIDPSGLSEDELVEMKMGLPARLPELLPAYITSDDEFMEVLLKFIDPDPQKRFGLAERAESLAAGGLAKLHQKLTLVHSDSQYDRDLESYISLLFPAKSNFEKHQQMLA
jgi:eukaryotic-like serine/threonine-protein kinase